MNKIKVEKKIYELLGVKIFKKATFSLEKIIHTLYRKLDKKKNNTSEQEFENEEKSIFHNKNINYHIKGYDLYSLDDFKKFLYYNGFIHVKNSYILATIIVSSIVFNFASYWLVPVVILLIKDLYCVMLQRYNWLNITEHQKKIRSKLDEKVLKEAEKLKNNEKVKDLKNDKVALNKTIETIDKLTNYLNNTDDTIYNEDDIESLDIIKEILDSSSKPVIRTRKK